MKVSIVIPYYNDREFLPQAIESVLNQSFEDFELILVNHATTDDCREIAHSYKDSRIVHFDMEKNYLAGTGLMMIRALKIAKGKYIKPFCADDIMYSNCLKDFVDYMEAHPEKDFAFGNIEYVDENGNSKNTTYYEDSPAFKITNDEAECIRLYLKPYSVFPYIGSFVKTDALKSIEISKSFIYRFNMAIWLCLLIKGYKVGYMNNIVAGHRFHSKQVTSFKRKVVQSSAYEQIKYAEIFYDLVKSELFNEVFKDNYYFKMAKELNELDKNFIISYELLMSASQHMSYVGYQHIYEMLQNDEQEKYLWDKFKFSVKEFRDIYTTVTYNAHPNCSVGTMIYISLRKLAQLVTFKKLR